MAMIVAIEGSAISVAYTATTTDGTPADVTTATVSFRTPAGMWTTPAAMTHGGTGQYTAAYLPPDAGLYSVLIQTTGPNRAEVGNVAVLAT